MWEQTKRIFEAYMKAVTFAEVGEHETALQMIEPQKKSRKRKSARRDKHPDVRPQARHRL